MTKDDLKPGAPLPPGKPEGEPPRETAAPSAPDTAAPKAGKERLVNARALRPFGYGGETYNPASQKRHPDTRKLVDVPADTVMLPRSAFEWLRDAGKVEEVK